MIVGRKGSANAPTILKFHLSGPLNLQEENVGSIPIPKGCACGDGNILPGRIPHHFTVFHCDPDLSAGETVVKVSKLYFYEIVGDAGNGCLIARAGLGEGLEHGLEIARQAINPITGLHLKGGEEILKVRAGLSGPKRIDRIGAGWPPMAHCAAIGSELGKGCRVSLRKNALAGPDKSRQRRDEICIYPAVHVVKTNRLEIVWHR